MLLFGDQIDKTICVSLGLSTMAAAALGNAGSDVAGVFASSKVEAIAGRLGFDMPKVTDEIRDSLKFKRSRTYGASLGVFLGCIIGMWPLLGYDPRKAETARIATKQEEIFSVTVEELCKVLSARNGRILLRKDAASHPHPERILNIADIKSTPYYVPALHDNYENSGYAVKTFLSVPIVDFSGSVMGTIELVNKSSDTPFTDKDEDVVAAVCSHIASELTEFRNAKDFREVIQGCAKNMMNAPRRLLAVSESQRIDRLFNDVLNQLKYAFQSEASLLALVDHERGELVSRSKTEGIPDFRSSIDEGIMGRVARTGTAQLINDIKADPEYNPERYQNYKGTGIAVRSVLCHPVFDSNRKVIAVIEILNKGNSKFDDQDSNLLRTIASHIALNLEGQGSSLKKVLKIVKDQYLAAGLGDKQEVCLQDGKIGLLEPARVVCYVRGAQGLEVSRVGEIGRKLFNRPVLDPQSYLTLEVVIGDPKRGKDRPVDGRPSKSDSSSGVNPDFDQNLIVEVPAGQKVYCVLKLWRKSVLGASKLVGEISRSVDGLRQGSEPVIQEIYLTGINGKPLNTKLLVNWSVIAMPK